MKCQLCELEIADAGDACRFHVGRCTHDREKLYDEWRQMAMDGHGVPDEDAQAMMIAQAYRWSCCGGGGQAGEDGEAPRLHEWGCQQAPAHLTEARICCVFDQKHEAFARAAAGELAASGLLLELREIEGFQGEIADETDGVIFLTAEGSQDLAATCTEAARAAYPDLPMVIFSDPERVDGWRLQASSSEGLTHEDVRAAIVSALRHRHARHDGTPQPFLSYSRAAAGRTGQWRRLLGPCWVDEERLQPGVQWSNEIEDGIANASTFILILTEQTAANSYCWRELRLARENDVPVVVLAHDGAETALMESEDGRHRSWERARIPDTAIFSDHLHRAVLDIDGERCDTLVFVISRDDENVSNQTFYREAVLRSACEFDNSIPQKWPDEERSEELYIAHLAGLTPEQMDEADRQEAERAEAERAVLPEIETEDRAHKRSFLDRLKHFFS